MTPPITGLDISAWQADVDQRAAQGAGHRFVYIKATEGLDYVSDHFAAEWAEAAEVGWYRGPYHFFHPLKDPEKQARKFHQVAADQGFNVRGDLSPGFDFEAYKGIRGVKPDRLVDSALACLAALDELFGDWTLLYLGPSFWKYRVKPAKRALELLSWRLWLPCYAARPLPMPWTNGLGGKPWTIWQKTGTGRCPGVRGNVDLNEFAGTEADLLELAGVEGAS